ncbi:hypothetical protein IT418_02470 [bacterium]|nr:hypothetical protein [bacterium]
MTLMSEWKVIKLGGSLLSPYETASRSLRIGQLPFDMDYTRELLNEVKISAQKIVFVIGGGFLNRWYLQQMRDNRLEKPETVTDFHILGMAASDINATIFRILAGETLSYDNVYPSVVKYDDYTRLQSISTEFDKYQIVVAAGWKPGHSHDVDALMFSTLFGNKKVYSFKNIDGIYSADPRMEPTAKKKKTLTWESYQAIIKSHIHKPGANFPIDPIAASLAETTKTSFVVIDGRDIRAVREVFTEGRTTRGSTILSG